MAMEPKLLTVADIDRFPSMCRDDVLAELRERGLIAPEPDPLEAEAQKLVHVHYLPAGKTAHDLALAALRRGVELRPTLTREMVRDAWCYAHGLHKSHKVSEDYVDRLHAALTEAQQ